MDDLEFDMMDGMGSSGGNDGNLDIELLMNTNMKENSTKFFGPGGHGNGGHGGSRGLDSISQLDNSLDDLNMGNPLGDPMGDGNRYHHQSNMFRGDDLGDIPSANDGSGPFTTSFNENPTFINESGMSSLGGGGGTNINQTWDNFAKYDNIPHMEQPPAPQLSAAQEMRKKMELIRKMEYLEKKCGYRFMKKYTLTDSLQEMLADFETYEAEVKRNNLIQGCKKTLLKTVQGIEWVNTLFNPFDVDLLGYTNELEEEIELGNGYDEIFEKLAVKYGPTVENIAPEIKLLYALSGSMGMFIAKKQQMIQGGSSMGMGQANALNQYPDANRIAEQSLLNAAMGDHQQNMQNQQQQQQAQFYMQQNNQQNSQQQYPNAQNYLPNNNNQMPNYNRQPTMQFQEPVRTRDVGGIDRARGGNNSSIDTFAYKTPINAGPPEIRTMRPEMNGPRDISGILSGVKTKTLNIPDDESVVTVDELKSMGSFIGPGQSNGSGSGSGPGQGPNINLPRRRQRKPDSLRSNTLNL